MRRSNLVPEYRTDRNGRNVLRHVRSDKGASISPVLSTAHPSVTTTRPVCEPFSDSFRLFWDRQEMSETGYSEENFDPRAVKVLNRIFSPESELQPFELMAALTRGFNEMLGSGDEEDGRVSIHNIAAFADDIHHLRNVRQAIEGLHLTLGYRKDYLLDSNDEDRAVAVAIMKATEVIGERIDWEEEISMETEKYGVCLFLRNPELTALIVEFAPRIDDLLEIIDGEDNMMQVETLRSMLSHDQHALAKGVL